MQTHQTDGESQVVESSEQPDYSSVEISSEAPTEYTYVERRAELLQLVEQAGHPKAINQSELADRYDVSQQQISKDLDRLDEYTRQRLAKRRDLKIGSALDRALRGALNDEDWDAARRVAEAYHSYLDDRIGTLEFRRRLDRLEDVADQEAPR